MNVSRYLLFFIGALGAFNGIMLGMNYLSLVKKKNLPGILLSCMLVALSLRIGKSVLVYFNPALAKIYLQIGLSACLLIGPLLFFFTKAAIEQPATLPKPWKRQLIVLLSLIVTTGVLYPYTDHVLLWNRYIIQIIYAVWLIYLIATGVSLRSILSRIIKKKATVQHSEKWLTAIFGANVLIHMCFQLALLFHSHRAYYGGAVIFSFVLYGMIIVLFYQGKSAGSFYLIRSKLPDNKRLDSNGPSLVQSLNQAMLTQSLFKNPNLTLAELAKAINMNSHQLSQLINDHLGKNFTSYVNSYRIDEACRMIAADHPFAVEAIGYEVGFNSKSTFYTAFRKITSMTPLQYKESLFNKQLI